MAFNNKTLAILVEFTIYSIKVRFKKSNSTALPFDHHRLFSLCVISVEAFESYQQINLFISAALAITFQRCVRPRAGQSPCVCYLTYVFYLTYCIALLVAVFSAYLLFT